MTRKRFHSIGGIHGLKKVKIRASWNKHNLYNLIRLRRPRYAQGSFYQQKWAAKSITRGYHGEHVREGYWERMFQSRMQAVVPMDYKYLAENDGSELAAGTGSGKELPVDPAMIKFDKDRIPYMSQTYAPLERRLDMAVWRALFASSARQARQFCTHGLVRVNGQKMPYAGYLLNPGDMFQVEPDSVMFATGAKKEVEQTKAGRAIAEERLKVWRRLGKKLKIHRPTAVPVAPALKKKKSKYLPKIVEEEEPEEEEEAWEEEPVTKAATSPRALEIIRAERKLSFDKLLLDAQRHVLYGKTFLGAKRKQHLRALMKDIRIVRANVNRLSEEELDTKIVEFVDRSIVTRRIERHAKEEDEVVEEIDQGTRDNLMGKYARVRENKVDENPYDPEKPYATPWKPRPYMSPFAFIPRYLEVNHRICSAVYLRHPVARPGMSEVPSPFPKETHQLAHTWYLRRR